MQTITIIFLILPLAALAYSTEHVDIEGVTHDYETFRSDKKSFFYHLFTRNNPKVSELIDPDNVESLMNSRFNKTNPTRIIIHGWLGDEKTNANILIRDALLEVGEYNVISVDWKSVAKNYFYPEPMFCVPDVGERIAEFIDFLNEEGDMPFSSLVLIGFSLGAHVAGATGRNVKNGRIPQIIALDPPYIIINKVKASDADYVETILTSGLSTRFVSYGTATFFPNGGRTQPGCGLKFVRCAHDRAFDYYAEAIRNNNFVAKKCKSESVFVMMEKRCNVDTTIRMGSPTNYLNASGYFYVPVTEKSPFGTA